MLAAFLIDRISCYRPVVVWGELRLFTDSNLNIRLRMYLTEL